MSARKKKKKIVIPSEGEVAQYAGGSASDGQAPGEGAAQADGASPEAGTAEAVEKVCDEVGQWKEKFLRAKADLANYQRRAEKDRSETLRYANARLVKALLPILDDLERVVASGSEQAGEVEAVASGVRLTLDNFLKVLRDFDVQTIEAEGQPFNPAVHEAMMQQPSEEHSDPTVLQEVVKGYQLHERVLRPSRVIVSKPIADENEDSEAAPEQPDADDQR